MIKIILSGCNGKMGKVVSELAKKNNLYEIVAGLDVFNMEENIFPVYKNFQSCKEDADVIIDFSHPNSLENLLNFALQKNIPAVIATTGLSQQQILKIKQASSKIPVFFSANMSIGVNLLTDIVCRAAKLLEDSFDIEIVEKHHNQKIDAPSGTALAIANAITSTLNNTKEYVYDRHSVRKKRGVNEIGMHAIRGGTIVGEHTVIFAGNDEIIEFKHRAMSKEIFAVGALKAAKFIVDKNPSMYDMKDLVASI